MATKTIKAWINGAIQYIEVEDIVSPEQPISVEKRVDTLEGKHEVVFTDGNLLVGNGTVELEEMTPEDVLSHINGASVVTLTTAEYEALGDNVNANTLYIPTDSDNVDVYVQNDEPTEAEEGALWLDMDELGDAFEDYATKTYVITKIAEAQLSGSDIDLSDYATKDDIPTKTSELTNDSNFITASGSPVRSVNGKTGVVSLTASDVGALPDTTEIPAVPTNVSAFTNDAGYLTEHQSAVLYTAQTLTDGQKAQARANIGVLEPLIGYSSDITPAQVSAALQQGREVVLAHMDANYGVIVFSGFIEVPALDVVATSGIQTLVVNNVGWTMRFSLAGSISQGLWHFEYDRIANYSDIPNALPNPNALTFTGAVTGTYDGSSAVTVDIPAVSYNSQTLTESQQVQARLNIGAVSMEEITGASNSLLGQTPLTLQEGVFSLRLTGEGDVSYTIKSDTVSDLENCTSKTPNNATFTKYEDCVEIKSTGGSGWYQSYIDVVLGGLTVGESYKFVVDASGHDWDPSNKVSNGKYIVYSDSGATLATVNVSDVAGNVFSINFTATTEKVKIRAYPGDYMYTPGQSVARFNSFYINRSTSGTRHTEIVDESGTFTDSTVLTAQPSGVTITCTPTCSVYGVIQSDTDNAIKSRHGGKVCVCFGDSITGNMVSPNDYPSIIAAETGMKVINGGFGGCRMSDTHQTAAYAAFSMVKLADAIVSGDWTLQNNNVSGLSTVTNGTEHLAALKEVDWNSVDFITIAYGTNDIQNYITIDDTANPKSTNTYLGSLRYSIEKILTAYPHIKLMVLTPMYRYWPDESADSDSKTFNGSKFTEWGDGLIKVAEEYKIPYIDMYRTLGFNAITRAYYSSDGTHPNVKGCKVIGGKIAGRLLAEY